MTLRAIVIADLFMGGIPARVEGQDAASETAVPPSFDLIDATLPDT